ncbi:MAG: hypothetical protein ACRCW2_17140 [Cellulosilyticaceae bacterium]
MQKVLFEKIFPDSYDVLKYVYPTMQGYVKELIDGTKQYEDIEGMVLKKGVHSTKMHSLLV